MKGRYKLYIILSLIASLALTACTKEIISLNSADLMKGVKAEAVEAITLDDTFISGSADFSLKLFKESITKDKNSLISPTSVLLALAMTANGAEDNTLKEMESLLAGKGNLQGLNDNLYSYLKNLPNSKKSEMTIANSIWFRDEESLKVKEDFLKTNASYYNASIYKSDFNSSKTPKDINKWVENNTKGMIDKIIDKIDIDTVMYLINAVAFDAEWKNIYNKTDIYKGDFKELSGDITSVEFMRSEENSYIEDAMVTGFIRPYADDLYSFVALLPKEGVDYYSYINSLTGENFISLINNSVKTQVSATLPKFSYEYEKNLNEPLITLGIKDAFNASLANFKALGSSSYGNIYIGNVLHKTFISVDEKGTKAGAVTSVEMKTESAVIEEKKVMLDRPFVYAIIDNETKLPVFIGTVIDF